MRLFCSIYNQFKNINHVCTYVYVWNWLQAKDVVFEPNMILQYWHRATIVNLYIHVGNSEKPYQLEKC